MSSGVQAMDNDSDFLFLYRVAPLCVVGFATFKGYQMPILH